MYTPKYRYGFVAPRARSLWVQMPLIQYLNNRNIKPFLFSYQKTEEVKNEIVGELFAYNEEKFDVLLCETYGLFPIEKKFLTKAKTKRNFAFFTGISMNRRFTSAEKHYRPENTKLIDGICVADERTKEYFTWINNEIIYPVIGNPEWDIIKKYDRQIQQLKEQYPRLLVIGVGQFERFPEKQKEYYTRVIDIAEKEGFTVMANVHPDHTGEIPEYLRPYINDLHRYVRFAAASHIISTYTSGMTAECLMLGKKVAVPPFLPSGIKDPVTGFYKWVEDRTEWRRLILERTEEELYKILPLIITEDEIRNFLFTDKKTYTQQQVDNLFRWPQVDNYTEYFFKTMDKIVEDLG